MSYPVIRNELTFNAMDGLIAVQRMIPKFVERAKNWYLYKDSPLFAAHVQEIVEV